MSFNSLDIGQSEKSRPKSITSGIESPKQQLNEDLKSLRLEKEAQNDAEKGRKTVIITQTGYFTIK